MADETQRNNGLSSRIKRARVIVTCPGRNFVTLKIETEDGVYGLGDATLNGRELAVKSYLEDHVIPLLMGRDPVETEDTWQYLYQGSYWHRGAVTMTAIAAVDVALWDIKGKMLGRPVYDLLGGKSRSGVLVYGHANGRDHGEALEAVGRYVDLGYRAIRVQAGVPGLEKVYGVGKGDLYYEPADKEVPDEEVWDTPMYLHHTPQLFRSVRETYGDNIELLHDAHHRLTPIEAARVAKDLEPSRLFWLEDATPADVPEAFRLIRHHTTTPLAVGEIFSSIWDARTLIQEQLIDYVRASVVHAGGITHLRRIADFAGLYQVRTGCHGATDLSLVSMAAAVNFGMWVPNFGIQEYMRHTPETDEVFPHNYRFEGGYMRMDAVPGLGIDIDERAAAEYPYQRAYLPVARLRDGTMWRW